MYSTPELLNARLAFVRRQLDEVIGHLDPGLMEWAPATGMRTIAGQLLEIGGSEAQTIAMLKDGRWIPDEEVRAGITDPNDLTCLKAFLAKTRSESLAYIESLFEDELVAEIELKGWHEAIGLPLVPRAEVLRGIAQHEYYHVGQLNSYLWAIGDNPYNW